MDPLRVDRVDSRSATGPFGFLLAAWGALLGILLLTMFGHIPTGVLSGWGYVTQSVAATVALCAERVGAFGCVA